MLQQKREDRFQNLNDVKLFWKFLRKKIDGKQFCLMTNSVKIDCLSIFQNYYCGMSDDLWKVSYAASLLEEIVKIETNHEIRGIAESVYEHIDEEGKAIAAEMEQDNPSF